MPDHDLLLPGNRFENGGSVPDLDGGQGSPKLFPVCLVESHDCRIGASDEADKPRAVQQGMGGVSPCRRISEFEIFQKVAFPEHLSIFRVEAKQITHRSKRSEEHTFELQSHSFIS